MTLRKTGDGAEKSFAQRYCARVSGPFFVLIAVFSLRAVSAGRFDWKPRPFYALMAGHPVSGLSAVSGLSE